MLITALGQCVERSGGVMITDHTSTPEAEDCAASSPSSTATHVPALLLEASPLDIADVPVPSLSLAIDA